MTQDELATRSILVKELVITLLRRRRGCVINRVKRIAEKSDQRQTLYKLKFGVDSPEHIAKLIRYKDFVGVPRKCDRSASLRHFPDVHAD